MSGFKSEIIYDHYKETFQQQVKYLSQRNKYFILLLGLGAVLFFQLTNLTSINNLIEGLIQSNVSDSITLEVAFIHSFLIFTILDLQ